MFSEELHDGTGECCFEPGCGDPRLLKSIREGVCPLCDSPLDHSRLERLFRARLETSGREGSDLEVPAPVRLPASD